MEYRVFADLLIAPSELKDLVIEVSAGRIGTIGPRGSRAPGPTDIHAPVVTPGFVDTHVHGGFGLDLMDGKVATVEELSRRLPAKGVTAFLVTPLTAPWGAIRNACDAARQARPVGAAILGTHLEGPFLSPQYKGAQRADEMLLPDFAILEKEVGLDGVRIVSLAPELPGALDVIAALTKCGIQPSVGHAAATYDEVSQAIDAGACRATHCFNAMRGLHHREPGTVGAAMSRRELMAELIWDNVHVHPAVCQTLVCAKGPGGVVCVSDGTTGVGMPEGYAFNLWGLPARVADGAARLEDDTLAGSTIGMLDAFRNACDSLGLEQAVRLCATNPAQSLSETPERGELNIGSRADFLLFDERLNLLATYIGGEKVYEGG